MCFCIPHSLVMHPSMRGRDAERVDVRKHLVLGMEGRKGPRESEKKVWKVRGKSGASGVMQVRQEDMFKMKAVVDGEMREDKNWNRPY